MVLLELTVRLDWDEVYEAIRADLGTAFGETALGFEHIGSTSVSGLLAKPIVDVLVSLPCDGLAASVQPALGLLGFEYRGEFGVAQRHFFARRDCHVHCFRVGEGEWTTHLLFRDFLRSSEEGRAVYAGFKRETAEQVAWDRASYQQRKDRFVTEFLPTARAWADAVRWHPPIVERHHAARLAR